MASPQQPAPPANPFDGFDTFGSVAAPTQQPQPQQQQQQQWAAHQPQPTEQQISPQQQTMVAANVNPFATATLPQQAANGPNANVNPFGAPQVGGGMMMAPQPGFPNPNPSYPQQQQPQLQLQQHAYQPQQPHQQQIVPVAPNVASPWALNNQLVTTAPAHAQQPSVSFVVCQLCHNIIMSL